MKLLSKLWPILHQMGRGLACQDLGEMVPTADKIAQIERLSHAYRNTGGQGRIVLIAGASPTKPAFDFVAELAKRTHSVIEVLSVPPGGPPALDELLQRLTALRCDFQITFLRGCLQDKISDYSRQRQDVMAVFCDSTDHTADAIKQTFGGMHPVTGLALPLILLIGNDLLA